MGALDGVKILDLSWGIAGPLGVMLLALILGHIERFEPFDRFSITAEEQARVCPH